MPLHPRGMGCGSGWVMVLVWVFCSLPWSAPGADIEKEELREAVKALRQENVRLRGQLDSRDEEARRIEARDAVRQNLRLNLIAESEEGRSSGEWRNLVLKLLEKLRNAEKVTDRDIKLLGELSRNTREAMASAELVDTEKRTALEESLRKSDQAIKANQMGSVEGGKVDQQVFSGNEDFSRLSEAHILGVELNLGVAALDVGRKDGARVGMPFLVMRDEKVLATLTLVEVRETAGLALIERMEPDHPIEKGDTAMARKH